MSAFMDSCQVNYVYLDFAEVFDKFNHCLLIAMLEDYEVRGSLLRWLESYIKDRVPMANYEGSTSPPFTVLSEVGTPGIPLGPTSVEFFYEQYW